MTEEQALSRRSARAVEHALRWIWGKDPAMDESKDGVGSGNARQASSTAGPTIDVEKLAEKVYQLMRAEVRLARARGNKHSTRR